MQTSGGVDDNDVGVVGLGGTERVERYAGRVTAHLLLDNRNTHAFSPNAELLYGRGAEGIGCAEIHFFPRFLE